MSNQSGVGKPDQVIINITDRNGVEFWTDKFDITTVQLKAAINAVGGAVKDVEMYLKRYHLS